MWLLWVDRWSMVRTNVQLKALHEELSQDVLKTCLSVFNLLPGGPIPESELSLPRPGQQTLKANKSRRLTLLRFHGKRVRWICKTSNNFTKTGNRCASPQPTKFVRCISLQRLLLHNYSDNSEDQNYKTSLSDQHWSSSVSNPLLLP